MSDLKTTKLIQNSLHYPEFSLAQCFHSKAKNTNSSPHYQACLNKYFPKYYKTLEKITLSKKDWSLTSKLKQAKIIRHFRAEAPKPIYKKTIDKLEEQIFRNKNKSVKTLPAWNPSDSYVHLLRRQQVSNFFPRITSLDLKPGFSRYFSEDEAVFVDREHEEEILGPYNLFWKKLRYLKHLRLSNDIPYYWLLVQQINSSPRFLASLEKLELSLSLRFDRKINSYHRDVLAELSRNEHFLKHLTHLNFKDFEGFQYYGELIRSILIQCPKLASFSFPIGRQAYYFSSPDEIYKECKDTQVLSYLENMKNLQALNVSIHGFKTFAKHLSMPCSLRKITLNVCHSFYDPSLMNLIDGSGGGSFVFRDYISDFEDEEYDGCNDDDHEKSSVFLERWRKLKDLEILQFELPLIRKSNDVLHKFVFPLLESTPKLKEFECKFKDSPACKEKWEELDLPLFFKNLTSFKSLKTIRICKSSPDHKNNYHSYISFPRIMKFDSKKNDLLPNLTELEIESPSFAMEDFKNSLKLFPSVNIIKKKLKFSALSLDSAEALNDCLKLANREAQGRNLELDLAINLWIGSVEELVNNFKWPIVLERGVAVKVNLCLKCPSDWESARKLSNVSEEEKQGLNKIFGNLDFNLALLQSNSNNNSYQRYDIPL